jgi:hypothetical protein
LDSFSSAFLPQTLYKPSLPSFVTSALKKETACYSETQASTYETIRRQNPRQHQQSCSFYGWWVGWEPLNSRNVFKHDNDHRSLLQAPRFNQGYFECDLITNTLSGVEWLKSVLLLVKRWTCTLLEPSVLWGEREIQVTCWTMMVSPDDRVFQFYKHSPSRSTPTHWLNLDNSRYVAMAAWSFSATVFQTFVIVQWITLLSW